MPYPFIESPHQTAASGRSIGVVVIHTMEIAERAGAAEICARWFENPASEVSAHYCVDADSIVQCVREEDIAWHARGGNANSIGIELAGYAGQRALGWNDAYSRAVVERASRLTADVCARYGIPCGASGRRIWSRASAASRATPTSAQRSARATTGIPGPTSRGRGSYA